MPPLLRLSFFAPHGTRKTTTSPPPHPPPLRLEAPRGGAEVLLGPWTADAQRQGALLARLSIRRTDEGAGRSRSNEKEGSLCLVSALFMSIHNPPWRTAALLSTLSA